MDSYISLHNAKDVNGKKRKMYESKMSNFDIRTMNKISQDNFNINSTSSSASSPSEVLAGSIPFTSERKVKRPRKRTFDSSPFQHNNKITKALSITSSPIESIPIESVNEYQKTLNKILKVNEEILSILKRKEERESPNIKFEKHLKLIHSI
ncbi:hypothetical protein SNEBB_009217 [Seison nebaliae]|nr:hypothetical protein SNEBB_009217 [Seison nebaliae]